jgi:hypothetical protein
MKIIKINLWNQGKCSEKSTNTCDINTNCTNTPGSYNCQCDSGFSGDGKNCTGIE